MDFQGVLWVDQYCFRTNVTDLLNLNIKKVCLLLYKFVAVAKQENSILYAPNNLLQFITNLQNQAFARNHHECHFINSKDLALNALHNLDNLSKNLLTEVNKKQARIISESEWCLSEGKENGMFTSQNVQGYIFNSWFN